jgi:hypothetical protein
VEAVKHDLTHFFQTAEVNCGYTALAMKLSHYGSVLTPKDIYRSAPRAVADGVELPGSLATQLAAWALGHGYRARLTTFDFLIIDLAWACLDGPALVSRLKAIRDSRHVPSLGTHSREPTSMSTFKTSRPAANSSSFRTSARAVSTKS